MTETPTAPPEEPQPEVNTEGGLDHGAAPETPPDEPTPEGDNDGTDTDTSV